MSDSSPDLYTAVPNPTDRPSGKWLVGKHAVEKPQRASLQQIYLIDWQLARELGGPREQAI